ncbi:hypothetical protein DF152_17070 [Burkholderia cenocepacia]|nr:hypothetical protein DF152_17070 [Burkholderia cenocepacia]
MTTSNLFRRVHGVDCLVGVLAVVLLALVLGGCAAPVPTPRVMVPPTSLMQDCAHAPRPADNTVNGLLLGIIAERGVTESCDWADKAALRAWAAGVQATQGTK